MTKINNAKYDLMYLPIDNLEKMYDVVKIGRLTFCDHWKT
jgi:hypothetical protein